MKFKCIILAVIVGIAGFFLGYYLGIQTAINVMIRESERFISIDHELIREYLVKAGL